MKMHHFLLKMLSEYKERSLIIKSNALLIRGAVLGAMKIQSDLSSSRAHFLKVLNYGRDLYCKGDPNIINTGQKRGKIASRCYLVTGTLR